MRAITLKKKFWVKVAVSPSQYTGTRLTSPSADPITQGSWQGSHWSANVEVTGLTQPGKRSMGKAGITSRSLALGADALQLDYLGSWRGQVTGWVKRQVNRAVTQLDAEDPNR